MPSNSSAACHVHQSSAWSATGFQCIHQLVSRRKETQLMCVPLLIKFSRSADELVRAKAITQCEQLCEVCFAALSVLV